jgi:very-short-patch-repair endonuclease
MEYDEVRTEIINAYGIEVIRFSNFDIDHRFSEVCRTIDDKVKEKLQNLR